MRLFIAVCFEDEIKDRLYESSIKLREMSHKGNFTRRENFHLTLHFIGETSRVSSLKKAMNAVSFKPFELCISKCGCFKRSSGDIYWIGIEENDTLYGVYKDLAAELNRNGFKTEARAFKPHLTIGREVVVKDRFDMSRLPTSDFPTVKIHSIYLMQSERINAKLVYTPIYEKRAVET